MRALLIVLDSVGVGGAPDAGRYGDEGADTLRHVRERTGVELPTLWSLGLGHILGEPCEGDVRASHGRMRERSAGKDSTTGHWEIAGVVLDTPFRTFERFPDALVDAIEREADTRFLGNVSASGTRIIAELGAEHLRTGWPILYTSADSVLQIAAHEEVIPVERLYAICTVARQHADAHNIGRVIARPFVGVPGRFERTSRRHDFSIHPPPTVLDAIAGSGLPVKAVGKVADLFAGQGITKALSTESNEHGLRMTEAVWRDTGEGLVFTNLVDFDTVYGHRRDPEGYARALATFDAWLAGFLPCVSKEDLLIITADHGNDPTFRGTDHTREEVPLIVRYGAQHRALGVRTTFSDVAATLARAFGLLEWPVGEPFIP